MESLLKVRSSHHHFYEHAFRFLESVMDTFQLKALATVTGSDFTRWRYYLPSTVEVGGLKDRMSRFGSLALKVREG